MDEEPFIIITIVYFCLYLFFIPPISNHKKPYSKYIEEARVKKNNLMKRESEEKKTK